VYGREIKAPNSKIESHDMGNSSPVSPERERWSTVRSLACHFDAIVYELILISNSANDRTLLRFPKQNRAIHIT
jgi:hypothetical protein